jgi:hypothetical protein
MSAKFIFLNRNQFKKEEQTKMSPEKFIRCVKEVAKKSHGKYNPYAVCRVSTGYKGSTHDIGLIHKKHK